MERLTIRTPQGASLNMADEYENEAAARKDLMRRYLVAIDRLAAYEDTGLEPEEIEKLACTRELSPEAEYAINQHVDNIIARLDAILQQDDDTSRWICTEDRLPDKKYYFHLVYYIDGVGDTQIGIAAYQGDGEWIGEGFDDSGCAVTHWMPLPEAPKEAEG